MKISSRLFFIVLTALLLSLTFTQLAAQDPVTINLWIFEGEDEFLPTVIAAFQAEHPHIMVQITDIPESEYVTKIDTALLAGAPPDLGYIYERRWIAAGAFLPLDEAIAAQGINLEDYNAGALSACAVDGHVYCIGTYTGAVLLFYNKDTFDAAGVPYPSATEPMSIDEYAAMVTQLSVASDDPATRVWGGNANVTYWWMHANSFFSEDRRTVMGFTNDEATTHTYQVMADLVAAGSIMSPSELTQMEGLDLLSTGQLATSITDNAVALPLLENANMRWGASVLPVEKEGDPPYVPIWSDGLGVFASSAHPEEAILFSTFLGTVGNQLRLDVTGDLPLNMKLAEDNNWAGDSEGRQEILAAVQTASPPAFIPDFFSVMSPIDEAYGGLMIEDGLSAQEAFDEMTPIIQENLDEAWATWDQLQQQSQ
jgi:multiple sugar transport system substrate-binding protein